MAKDSEYWDPENSHVEDWQPEQGHWKPGDKMPKFSKKKVNEYVEKRTQDMVAEVLRELDSRYPPRR